MPLLASSGAVKTYTGARTYMQAKHISTQISLKLLIYLYLPVTPYKIKIRGQTTYLQHTAAQTTLYHSERKESEHSKETLDQHKAGTLIHEAS